MSESLDSLRKGRRAWRSCGEGRKERVRRGSECCGGRSERGSSARRTAIRDPSRRPLGTGSCQSS